MTRSLFPKISLLLGLAIVTYVTTTVASKRLRGATSHEAPAQGVILDSRMHNPAEVEKPLKPLEEWDSSITLKATLKDLTVERDGDFVNVSMDASALSREPGTRFAWAVAIVTQGGDVVYDILYQDRVVTIPEGKITASPHFEDRLALPPGVYRVVGSFLSMPADFDLAKADGVDSLKPFLRSQRFTTIGLD
jgi:hypothetical protein